MVAPKRDRHRDEKLLPSGDRLVRPMTQRQQLEMRINQLLEQEDNDGDEAEDEETA